MFSKPRCHSEGIFFNIKHSARAKKDSLACLEPLAGQASRMTACLVMGFTELLQRRAKPKGANNADISQ
jgi:hypothetical protein